MDVTTREFCLPTSTFHDSFQALCREVERNCGPGVVPLRFASVATTDQGFRCEVEVATPTAKLDFPSIFQFRQRSRERSHQFNAVMLIPTGIDCCIGGHAGDATPAARTLAAVCDHLVLHPNVVNASDINEQPENSLYVEGSLICRLMMGTIGLRKVRRNRMLLVTERRDDGDWVVDQVVNTVSGARATLGLDCETVVVLDQGLDVRTCYAPSGRATGRLGNLEHLIGLLHERRGDFDVVALATKITPHMDSVALHQAYFNGQGPNPWGGAEAALTHTVSSVLNVPTAHAPTMSDLRLRTEGYGQVEPRKAAEIVSMTYLFCVLKGLHRAPQVEIGRAHV